MHTTDTMVSLPAWSAQHWPEPSPLLSCCLQVQNSTIPVDEELKLPPLKVTVPGHECLLTVANITQLAPSRFADLWKVQILPPLFAACLDAFAAKHSSARLN